MGVEWAGPPTWGWGGRLGPSTWGGGGDDTQVGPPNGRGGGAVGTTIYRGWMGSLAWGGGETRVGPSCGGGGMTNPFGEGRMGPSAQRGGLGPYKGCWTTFFWGGGG